MSEKNLFPYILEFMRPQSVAEIGCGKGELLEAFQQRGAEIQGIDAEEYAKGAFWQKNMKFFQSANLESVRISCQGKFDLVVCMECAHKFPEERAEPLVHDLCQMSDVVLFSSGIPGQEEGIANGQMSSYWGEIFNKNGFIMLDCIRPKIWSDADIGAGCRQNLRFYVKEVMLSKYPSLMKFYLSNNVNQFDDIVHPQIFKEKADRIGELKVKLGKINEQQEISRLLERVKSSSAQKDKVAILCNQKAWEDLFAFLDMEEIDVCAYFGIWEQVPELLQSAMKNKFYSLDEFSAKLPDLEVDFYITVIPFGPMMSTYYPQLHSCGIGNERILNLSAYFGAERYVGLTYYYQWNYLVNEKPEYDYFITGASSAKMGFYLNFMEPYKGIKLLTNAQDLYYQYKIAEIYLKKGVSSPNNVKFALIELCPGTFSNILMNNSVYFNEIYYFPIISHENTEYNHTKRGYFMKKVLGKKAVEYLNFKIRDIKGISWNDRDGQLGAMNFQNATSWSEEAKDRQVKSICSGSWSYEAEEFNVYILEKYIQLCEEYHIIPILLNIPYASRINDNYPAEYKNRYFDILKRFGNRVRILDLWRLQVPEEYTSDLIHLNSKGAKLVTEAIKSYVDKLGLA